MSPHGTQVPTFTRVRSLPFCWHLCPHFPSTRPYATTGLGLDLRAAIRIATSTICIYIQAAGSSDSLSALRHRGRANELARVLLLRDRRATAARRAVGGPGSPLGQLLLACELAFAGYGAARYVAYNRAVLQAREEARGPEDVEALWRLFSHNRAGLLRHVRLEAFLQDWFWGDEDAAAAAAAAATAAVGGTPDTPSEKVAALPGGAAALESKLAALEAAAGCRFAPGGPTPGRRVMAHLREPLKVSYSVDELAVGVRDALAALGHPRATLVGHSYGTLVASRFSKLFPEQVHSLVLLDAVCFGMVMPQLLRGSIYYHLRPPSEIVPQNRRRQAAAAAAAAVAAQEALPPHSLVVLSGRDHLVGAEALAAMLRGAGCGDCLMLHPGLDHGEILKDAAWRAAVVHRIAHVTAEADADLAAAARAAQLLRRRLGLADRSRRRGLEGSASSSPRPTLPIAIIPGSSSCEAAAAPAASTAALLPVLPDLLARAAPVLAEMWALVKPLMPRLLRAILPVMPRFFAALLPTFERQPLLQSRQRAEELQRWHAQAGLWGGGGLPQAAADVATAMQQGLHESGMLSFRGWSGSLRRQVLLRGRGGFASSAGRRGAGGSAEPRNWLSGRRV
eukprot:XP_001697476.1 predicted protein [Chlamydomonas reinhardtii]